MERQIRNLSRLLLAVTLFLVVITIGMTARYGWNTTVGSELDKAWQAGINGTIDVAGPAFAGLVGMCWGLGYRKAGVICFILSLLCAIFTYQAIIGFQSSSRETLAQTREDAHSLSKGFMSWATDTVTKQVADEKSKEKTKVLANGIDAVGAQVKDQIRLLQSGNIPAADGQATTFARMFSTSEQSARSWVISLTAAIIIIISYGAAGAYGFARQQLEPAIVAQSLADSRAFTVDKPGKSGNLSAFTEDEARADIGRLLATGYQIDNFSFLARRWGWTANKTNRWLRQQSDLDVPPPGRRGQRKAISQHINGNGRVHA